MLCKKIVLGLGIYGWVFKFVNLNKNGLGVLVSGKVILGKYIREGGFLFYYEICIMGLIVV